MPGQLAFATLNPWLGAVLFGFLSGSALLALFRHGASLGGIGILALMLQDRLGWRAGWVQLVRIEMAGRRVGQLIVAVHQHRAIETAGRETDAGGGHRQAAAQLEAVVERRQAQRLPIGRRSPGDGEGRARQRHA